MVVNDALSAIDEPLILATIAFLDVDADELNADIGVVDEPLILATIEFLEVDADPLNVATDKLIAWSVVVSELLNEDIGAIDEPLILVTNSFLASEDEPLSIVVEEAYEAVWANDEVVSNLISTDEDMAYDDVKAYDEDNAVRY